MDLGTAVLWLSDQRKNSVNPVHTVAVGERGNVCYAEGISNLPGTAQSAFYCACTSCAAVFRANALRARTEYFRRVRGTRQAGDQRRTR